jgi:hypothetical protein
MSVCRRLLYTFKLPDRTSPSLWMRTPSTAAKAGQLPAHGLCRLPAHRKNLACYVNHTTRTQPRPPDPPCQIISMLQLSSKSRCAQSRWPQGHAIAPGRRLTAGTHSPFPWTNSALRKSARSLSMMIPSLAIASTCRARLIIGLPRRPSHRVFSPITAAPCGNARNAAGSIFGTRKAEVILSTVGSAQCIRL